ncbi:MAG: hypothetical protein ACREE1_04230, partial [Stellaceae bacterium]
AYKSLPNTLDLLIEKSVVLTAFITNNLDAATTEIEAHLEHYAPDLKEEKIYEKEIVVRLEEAACWYRVIDEMACRSLSPEQADLFMGHFQDNLARTLALQGTPPDLICQTMAYRIDEYSKYRKWVPAKDEGTHGTLLWEAAKHVGAPFGPGVSGHPIFLVMFGRRFAERLTRAMVNRLLNGR